MIAREINEITNSSVQLVQDPVSISSDTPPDCIDLLSLETLISALSPKMMYCYPQTHFGAAEINDCSIWQFGTGPSPMNISEFRPKHHNMDQYHPKYNVGNHDDDDITDPVCLDPFVS